MTQNYSALRKLRLEQDALYSIFLGTSPEEVAKHGEKWTVEQIHLRARGALIESGILDSIGHVAEEAP
jgi:hypothetical protein